MSRGSTRNRVVTDLMATPGLEDWRRNSIGEGRLDGRSPILGIRREIDITDGKVIDEFSK